MLLSDTVATNPSGIWQGFFPQPAILNCSSRKYSSCSFRYFLAVFHCIGRTLFNPHRLELTNMIEEMHTRKEQPFSPVHRPQLKVLPGHFEVRIGFRLLNGTREVLQRTLQGRQQF